MIRWFTKNWANTEEPTHGDLTPLVLPAEAVQRVRAVVGELPRWHAESRSRVGVGNLGQNRRHILEPWAAFRAEK